MIFVIWGDFHENFLLEDNLLKVWHCAKYRIGYIVTSSWEGRGNWYIQLVKVLYCKLLYSSKQLLGSPHEVGPGF